MNTTFCRLIGDSGTSNKKKGLTGEEFYGMLKIGNCFKGEGLSLERLLSQVSKQKRENRQQEGGQRRKQGS